MRHLGKMIIAVGLISGLLLLTACGGGNTPNTANNNNGNNDQPSVSIYMVSTSSAIVGETKTISVTIANTQNTSFTVSVIPASGSGCNRSGGDVVCSPTIAGTYNITVSADADNTKKVTCVLTVTEDNDNPDDPEESPEEPRIVSRVSALITAASGGTLTVGESDSLYSNGVQLIIPAGAVNADTIVTIGDLTARIPPPPDGTVPIGLPISLEPDGLVFNKPITVKIPYTDEQLLYAGVSSLEHITLKTFNRDTNQWEDIPVKENDTENKFIIAELNHFSWYNPFSWFENSKDENPASDEKIFDYVKYTWGIAVTPDEIGQVLLLEDAGSFIPYNNLIGGLIIATDVFKDLKNKDYASLAKTGIVEVSKLGLRYAGYASFGYVVGLADIVYEYIEWFLDSADNAAFNRQVARYVEMGCDEKSNFCNDIRLDGWFPSSGFAGSVPPAITGKFVPADLDKIGTAILKAKQAENHLVNDDKEIKEAFKKDLDNLRSSSAPDAVISVTPSDLGNPPFTVIFNASSSKASSGRSIIKYEWDFGDDTHATGLQVTKIYDAVGNYAATLTIQDNAGNLAKTSKTIVVTLRDVANQPPIPVLNYKKEAGDSMVVYFDGSSSHDPDGTIKQYQWSFGDGGVEYGESPSHQYSEAGTYTVKLEVTDDKLSKAVKSVDITIDSWQDEPPQLTAPTNLAPGTNVGMPDTPPGLVLISNNVTFTWSAVSGAAYYDIGVRDITNGANGPLLPIDPIVGKTSHPLLLDANHKYKWDVAACNAANECVRSVDMYFQTPATSQSKPVAHFSTIAAGYPSISDGGTLSVSIPINGSILIDFDGASSSADEGTIKTYEWKVDDVTVYTNTLSFYVHTLTEPATYRVELIVTDNNGTVSDPAYAEVIVQSDVSDPYAGDAMIVRLVGCDWTQCPDWTWDGGDTWIWNGEEWIQEFPDARPPRRSDYGMAYDAGRAQVILFGGSFATEYLRLNRDDTWVWDGTTWTQKRVGGPIRRSRPAMAYDAAHDEVVMFGGIDGSSCAPSCWNYSDTWVWDGTTWTQKFPEHNPPVGAHSAAYDSKHGEVILYTDTGETWAWNGNDWIQRFPEHQPWFVLTIAYDAVNDQIIALSGRGGGYASDGSTWIWNGSDWAQVFPEHSPGLGGFTIMMTDMNGQVVGFRTWNNQTWVWDGTDWILQPS